VAGAVAGEALDDREIDGIERAEEGVVARACEALDREADVVRGDLAVDRRAEADAALERERVRPAAVRRRGNGGREIRDELGARRAGYVVVADEAAEQQVRPGSRVREVADRRIEAVEAARFPADPVRAAPRRARAGAGR